MYKEANFKTISAAPMELDQISTLIYHVIPVATIESSLWD